MTSPALVSMRGGACADFRSSCRSAYRGRSQSADTYYGFGFRVVCLPQEVAPPRMVLRGGSYLEYPACACRSAYRDCSKSVATSWTFGFRVIHLSREVAP